MTDYCGKYAAYRKPLDYGATVLSLCGLVSSMFYNWHLAVVFWCLAFLCKHYQSCLADRVLTELAADDA
jgi:hypothetical protein